MPEVSDRSQIELILSSDGYIRLPIKILETISLKHTDSGLYADNSAIEHGEIECSIEGYSEWVSETTPVISVGWDWKLELNGNGPVYKMVGQPFSNVMLQDDALKDLDYHISNRLLSDFIKKSDWSSQVMVAITDKYS